MLNEVLEARPELRLFFCVHAPWARMMLLEKNKSEKNRIRFFIRLKLFLIVNEKTEIVVSRSANKNLK